MIHIVSWRSWPAFNPHCRLLVDMACVEMPHASDTWQFSNCSEMMRLKVTFIPTSKKQSSSNSGYSYVRAQLIHYINECISIITSVILKCNQKSDARVGLGVRYNGTTQIRFESLLWWVGSKADIVEHSTLYERLTQWQH